MSGGGFGFLESVYEIQLVNYLVVTGMPVGLLIETKVEVKRKVRQLPNCSGRINRKKNPAIGPAKDGIILLSCPIL